MVDRLSPVIFSTCTRLSNWIGGWGDTSFNTSHSFDLCWQAQKKPAQHKLREPRCIAAPWEFCCCYGSIPLRVPVFRAHLGSNTIRGMGTLWLTAGQAVNLNRGGILQTVMDCVQ